MGTFLDFTYFICCLQTKEIALKRNDATLSELTMISSSLGQFQKVLIKIKQRKSLMALSLAPKKLRVV